MYKSTLMTILKTPRGVDSRLRRRLEKLLVMLLVLTVLLVPVPIRSAESYADDSIVELSVGEADSLLALIDQQDSTIVDLEAELWLATETLALTDSMRVVERQMLLEAINKEREDKSFIEEFLSKPELWLAAGLFLGAYAAR
jgi:hypothetical protein